MRKNYAYLEKIGGEWLDDFVYISKEPLKALGFEIRAFDGNAMEHTLTNLDLDIKYDIIIGSVEATNVFFKACGIETPKYLGYPSELKIFLARYLDDCKFGDLKKIFKYPYFIKPMNDVKLFTGEVITTDEQLSYLNEYGGVSYETEVFVSAVLPPIASEYRCFVHEDRLVGIQYYLGDFSKYPNVEMIHDMIRCYKTSNCAYTLDIGVLENGSTVLIEINDMWAIGSYGMDAKTYSLMCVRRMREIGRQANGETEPLWKKLNK
jgi:hypothetical protein